ncbi:hypothetical protein CEV08_02790 [Bartonella tribocorum]|uniref:Uncharacterized protein n=1 Tax=Bartonella tribocorum TaxID=85701 RepID=A0A2M6UWX0_9HYPH|nr:hypothetical protein CEV08_02790 [Bartonella tribocorum]
MSHQISQDFLIPNLLPVKELKIIRLHKESGEFCVEKNDTRKDFKAPLMKHLKNHCNIRGKCVMASACSFMKSKNGEAQ